MPVIDRRTFLASASLASVRPAPSQQPERTNLLFVLADQWRSSAFGFGSDAVVRTPHFDRMAGEGANWRRAYAANPVCTPNRACILTGRYSRETGMIKNDIQLPPGELCWPELFRDAGYATHYVGKWHLDGPPKPGYVPPGWRRRGFESFEGFNRGHLYHKPWGFDNEGRPLEHIDGGLPDPYYEPQLQTDLAIRFMRGRRSRPFACFLSWGPPHTPFRPPRKFRKYEPDEIDLRSNVPPEHEERARKELAGYYGLCESLDHEMGRLLAFLEESGLSESTLLVFTSDHGELAGSHGKYRKGEPEDESLRVPLLMRQPGRIPAAEPKTLISSVDLMPTLLSVCDLPAASTCSGRDLTGAVLQNGTEPQVRSVYCEGKVSSSSMARPGKNSPSQGPWRAVVTEHHKLVVRGDLDTVEGLFDLEQDPMEVRDLASDASAQGTKDDLLAELRGWVTKTGDTFPKRPPAAQEQYDNPAV